MNILVLGVGNILLSDEGIGVRVVEAFQQRFAVPEGVDVVDGGTSGMDLLDVIAERDHVIVVDAVRLDAPPGTLVRYVGDEVPAFFRARISPHQLGLSDVLAALKLLEREPRGLTLLGAVPEDLQPSLELSPGFGAVRENLIERLAGELRDLGVAVVPLADTAAGPSQHAS